MATGISLAIPLDCRLIMLFVLRLTQPVVNPEVRLSIGQQHCAGSNHASELVQSEEHHAEANISQKDERSFAATEHGAAGAEVALAQKVGCGSLKTA